MRARLPDETGVVVRDGVRIAYEVYGGGPETLLFVPPWSIVHSRVYKAQLPYFSTRYRCITYDGRGNGKSDRPQDVAAYSLENYAADTLAVMDATATASAIFVGGPVDILPRSFGKDLPRMGDWISRHFDFSGYIMGEHPQTWGSRAELRQKLGYRSDERVCIVTVGGSSVGLPLIRRILQSYPIVRRRLPELRMVVVTGPRIDPRSLVAPLGVEVRAFVSDLDRHLAACDLALVQGGLTTCMELTAAGTPFVYFPLKNHFEQNFHVAHRLDRYGAGRRMDYETATPDIIADAMIAALRSSAAFAPVEADGAQQAARMIAELL